MNKHLGLIIQAIVAETRHMGEENAPIDALCHIFNYMDEGCEGVACNDCMLGYKDYQYYTSLIIKTWRQL
ncbi:hypothetical protein KNV79_gp45 [Salmonella phage vB_SalP_TR2]|uniref:Uncharacterized protein n=1 Tax=Salmonella phage vB_SalP_TR2 TaxID=2812854 RepID=A0A898K907_9CAUD|nr:hypothetical protein KNV79_gp45 [Salmonella phage vB_SalP_TR2]QSJ04021.1 hypothetical protein [Salmonella phage vB_SalP_TR2]